MSKFRESEVVVSRCSSKWVPSKISQITQEKSPRWSLPSIKPQALRPVALLKKDCNTAAPSRKPRNLQEHPFLKDTPDDSSFWRKTKYDLSLKVRGQFPWSRAKTGGINQSWLITNLDQVQIIKNFLWWKRQKYTNE